MAFETNEEILDAFKVVLPYINEVLREDVAVEGVSQEVALSNAPEVHEGGFKVPRVIE